MSITATAWYQVNPSFVEPDVLLQINQVSNAWDLVAERKMRVKLGEGDLAVYIKRADVRTKVSAGQSPTNQLPSGSVVLDVISAPTYLVQARGEYDHHDLANAGRWGISGVQAEDLVMEQGIAQFSRNALLYGVDPSNGEGLVNAANAFAITLPPDSLNNTTVLTYDSGEMGFFLLQQMLAMKIRMYQLGSPSRFSIVGPQRVLGQFAMVNVVQLVQFQRTGAGSETTAGLIESIVDRNGDAVDWGYDDTLIGKGAGGTDMVIISVPEIVNNQGSPGTDTNAFARLTPNLSAAVLQYADMAAPRKIQSPLPRGAVDVLREWRITPGWAPRPQALTLISMPY